VDFSVLMSDESFLIYLVCDNKLYVSETLVPSLNTNAVEIDPEYLEKGEFIICSSCTGFGDWGILTAMPRILKQKFPNCKVYIPTKKWLMKVLEPTVNYPRLFYKWDNMYEVVEAVFKHNPFVDGFKDDISGIVYTDHFRYINEEETHVPLAKQMLRFYGLSDDEIGSAMPEIYFSDEELEEWNEIFTPNQPYGCLTISDRSWGPEGTPEKIKAIKDTIDFYQMPIIYFGKEPIETSPFKKYSKSSINMLDITNNIRFQTFIRMNARYNVGSQTGVLEVLAKYSETFMTVDAGESFKTYFINGIRYLITP
jgi:hypothetical protein